MILYDITMCMVQEKYNIHHLLPRSRGGNENKDNKVRFEVDQHVKFHGFFNHGIISEQIAQLIRLSDRALSKSVVEELCQLLKKEPECFYKDQVIKGEKILDRKYDSSGFFKENPKMLHHILPISRG